MMENPPMEQETVKATSLQQEGEKQERSVSPKVLLPELSQAETALKELRQSGAYGDLKEIVASVNLVRESIAGNETGVMNILRAPGSEPFSLIAKHLGSAADILEDKGITGPVAALRGIAGYLRKRGEEDEVRMENAPIEFSYTEEFKKGAKHAAEDLQVGNISPREEVIKGDASVGYKEGYLTIWNLQKQK